MKKGQSAIEFIVIIGAVLGFFILFIASLQIHQSEKIERVENKKIKKIAQNLKEEIEIASETMNGYKRNFTIPKKVMGHNYTIELIGDRIQIKTKKNALVIRTKNITGKIKKGENIIENKNGNIYLNSET